MHNNDELQSEVLTWLSKILRKDVDPNNLNATLLDDYEADSMDMVEIVEVMELQYGLDISNQQIGELKTVNDIIEKIQAHQAV